MLTFRSSETVAELQVNTSAFSAQYGIGGVIFNQVSKGGTSQFHGSLYEYFQNAALDAKGYGFGNQITVPFLRYNNYGGSIGGPILKKKMFFYFNYDKTANNGAYSGYTTVPTTAMLAGDFTGQPTIYDPLTQVVTAGGTITQPDGTVQMCPCVTRKSFAEEYGNGNKIPANLFDPVSPRMCRHSTHLPPTPSQVGILLRAHLLRTAIQQNNYYFNLPSPSPATKYFGRLDYDVSPDNRLTISDTQRDNAGSSPYIYACPVGCQTFDIDSNNAQISDVWNICATTINEARFGYTDQLNFYAAPTIGDDYPEKLGLKFSKANIFPAINIYGNNCCDGPGPATNATYKEMAFDPSDVVTMIRGKHIFHFGGEFLFYRDDTTAWGNISGANVQFYGN